MDSERTNFVRERCFFQEMMLRMKQEAVGAPVLGDVSVGAVLPGRSRDSASGIDSRIQGQSSRGRLKGCDTLC